MIAFFTAIGAWFAARKLAFLVAGMAALALAVTGVAFGLYQHGKSVAAAQCDAAAKQAQIEALRADLNLANLRAAHAETAIAGLLRQRSESERAVEDLQKEIASTKLQSTAPGAKIDANALLDDKCNYTARGARRVRE